MQKQQRLKTTEFENINAATSNGFYQSYVKMSDVITTECMVQIQAFKFPKKFDITIFQAPGEWLRNWKKK